MFVNIMKGIGESEVRFFPWHISLHLFKGQRTPAKLFFVYTYCACRHISTFVNLDRSVKLN